MSQNGVEGLPEEQEGAIGTKNQTGFMFTEIRGVTPAFIDFAKDVDGEGCIADLGCAYGIATIPVIDNTRCSVFALDLEEEHLRILRSSIDKQHRDRLTTQAGSFPDDFRVDDDSFDAIHTSFMFHFIPGDKLLLGLDKICRALRPGGKLFLNTSSIYMNIFKDLPEIYEKRKQEGVEWPGEGHHELDAPDRTMQHVRTFFHLHKLEDLRLVLDKTGFVVEDMYYFDIMKPASFQSGGRGQIAVIASKP